ncbi:MAG: hypothetical protein E6H91_14985 [Chloroflexi bacterium]|nr:MAG: hypothetical protein E6H91_14985 [Chloroflexota bacterium]
MSRYAPSDLEPAERAIHQVLSAVAPQALPLGFRDAVMRRVAAREGVAWEWIVAGVLALPSVAFLVYQVVTHGDEFTTALNNVMTAASAESADAFFFVDGTTVLALAILGIASLMAAHASIVAPLRHSTSR